MSIVYQPKPKKYHDEWKWVFIFRRRLGDWVVTMEWVQRRSSNTGYRCGYATKVEWRSAYGNHLHDAIMAEDYCGFW